MKKVLMMIFCALMLLSGCTGGKAENKVPDIAGKTFYDTADTFVYTEPTRLWLGKDESFVLSDYYVGGIDEYTGTWSVKDDVVTLKSDKNEFKFEVKDENTLILRTSLRGGNASDVFSTEKPKNEPLPYGIEFDYVTYYNANQDESNRSFLEIHDDGSFSLVEKGTSGTTDINGLWGKEGDAYMFSNFDPFKDRNGNTVYNFEFLVYDENSLILNEDLDGSKKGDIFTIDGKVPAGYTSSTETFSFKTQTWIHEPIQDLNEDFLPTITIATDFSFLFYENVFEGMGKYIGYCSPEQNGWACKVTDGSSTMGFNCGKNGEVGCDTIKEIIFESIDSETMELKTDLCMSRSGDRFKLWKD